MAELNGGFDEFPVVQPGQPQPPSAFRVPQPGQIPAALRSPYAPVAPAPLPKLDMQQQPLPKLDIPRFPTIDQAPLQVFPTVDKTQAPEVPVEIPVAPKKEKTITGFIGNFAGDATDTIKGIAEFISKSAMLPYDMVRDPAKYKSYLDSFMSDPAGKTREFGSNLVHAVIDPYAKNGWDVLYEKPFTVLADAAAVLSLGAGSAVKAGRIAGATTSAGAKLIEYGSKLNEVAHAIDPIQWGAKGIKTVFKSSLESIGVGSESAKFNSLRAQISAELDKKADNIIGKIDRGELVGEAAISKELAHPDRGLQGMPKFPTIDELVPVEGGAHTTDLTEVKPVALADSLDFNKIIENDKRLAGVKSKLEETLKSGNFTADSTEYQKRVVKFAFDATKQSQHLDAILNHLEEKGLVKFIDKPEDLGRLVDPRISEDARRANKVALGIDGSWEALPVNTYKKVLDESVLVSKDFLRLIESGASPEEAANRAIILGKERLEAGASLMKDVKTGERVAFVPKYVANYFDLEFGTPGRLAGINTNILKHWRPAVTTLRPSYVPAVASSNAIMAILAGTNPLDVFRLRNIDVPPEVLRNLGLETIKPGEKVLNSKILGKVSDLTGQANTILDTNLRASIYKKSIKDRILSTVRGVQMTQDELAAAVRETSSSVDRLGEITAAERRIVEELGATIPAYRSAVNDLNVAVTEVKRLNTLVKNEPALTKVLGPQIEAATKAAQKAEAVRDIEYSKIVNSTTAKKAMDAEIPGLRSQADMVEKAVEDANAFTGAKERLSPFEKRFMTQLIPFYNYTKMISQLAFRLPFLRPKSYFAFNRMAGMVNDLWDDNNTPDWVRDYFPVGTGADGQIHAIKITNLAPFNNIRTGGIGNVEVPGIFNPIQNPIISIIYNWAGGVPQWTKKPVSPDEYSVRLGTGAVYKIGADGKSLQQVIAQPPLLKDIMNSFPVTQFIDELMHPYMQSDRGYILDPKPILDPDGNPKFPKHVYDILASQILRTTTYDPEQLKLQHMKTLKSIKKGFLDKARRETDPELKAAAIQALQDLANQTETRIKNH